MKKWLSLLLGLFLCLHFSLRAETPFLDTGFHYYQEGEQATKPEVRSRAFNAALSFYLHLHAENPSGALLYNIGNCYYQLGEYGSATLYYYRALREMPRESKIWTNLTITAKKVGFEPPAPPSNFFFYMQFTPYECVLGLIASLLALFAFASFNLWHEHRVFRRLSIVSIGSLLFFSTILLWGYALRPLDAVVVNPTALFQGPGVNYVRASKAPLLPGTKVRVIEVLDRGGWMQVELSTGERGYLSGQQAQII